MPRPLADVIARALQVDVERRYQSIVEMEAALASVQRRDEAVGDRPGQAVAAASRDRDPASDRRLAILGAIKTIGFNNNFGRTGAHARFGVEPLVAYVRWGMLGIAPKLLVLTITAVVVMNAGIVDPRCSG